MVTLAKDTLYPCVHLVPVNNEQTKQKKNGQLIEKQQELPPSTYIRLYYGIIIA